MRPPTALAFLLLAALPAAAQTIGFESQGLPANSFRNDAGPPDGDHFFVDQGASFNNTHGVDATFGYEYWSGWSLSSVTDNATAGFGNQYAAIAGGGAGGSATYAVAFVGPTFVNLPGGVRAAALDITNTAYAYFSLRDGDAFARPIAAGDYFRLTIQGHAGLDGAGAATGTTEVMLADYTNGNSMILADWRTVDLSGLGAARSLSFDLTTTISNAFGPATPFYFAADNLTLVSVPEPGALGLVAAAGLAFAWRRRQSKASG